MSEKTDLIEIVRQNLPILNISELKELKNDPNREYIKRSIGNELALALQDAFKVKPDDTIEYIAMHLLNQNQSSTNLKSLKNGFKTLQELQANQKQEQAQASFEQELKVQEQNAVKEEREQFLAAMDSSENMLTDLDSVAEHLKKYTNATGVYFAQQEVQRTKSEPHDPIATKTEANDKTSIRFIASDAEHKFMLSQEQKEESVLRSFLDKKSEEVEEDKEEQEAGKPVRAAKYFNDDDEELKAPVFEATDDFKEKFYPEVIAEKDMTFYRVPRLGSLYLLKVNINNYFADEALERNVAENKSLREKAKHQKKLREEYEEELEQWKQTNQGDKPKKPVYEELKKLVPDSRPMSLVLALDTIGQERMFKMKERKYSYTILASLKQKYEAFQLKQLEVLHTTLEELEDKAVLKDFSALQKETTELIKEEMILPYTDEAKDTFLKFESTKRALTEPRFFSTFFTPLRKIYRMKYAQVVVDVLYLFAGCRKDELMVIDPIYGETNNVDWIKTRRFLNDDLKEKIMEYRSDQPKNGFYPDYHKLGYLEAQIKELKPADLNEFCGALAVLRDFVMLAIECRRIDRRYRLQKREEVIQSIEKLKLEKEEFDRRKKETLEKNEEWLEGEFSKPIPDHPDEEIDNDIEHDDQTPTNDAN